MGHNMRESMKKLFSRIKRKYNGSWLSRAVSFLRTLFKLNGNFFMPPSLAFYLIISCIPMISIVFMILSFYSQNSVDAVFDFILNLNIFSDEETINTIVEYLKNIKVSDYVALISSVVASLYVASRGIECFSRFSDHFYNKDYLDRKFLVRKARSIGITLIFIIGLSGIIIVFAGFDAFTKNFLSRTASMWLKYLTILVLLFAVILALYKLAPTVKTKTRDILPGAYLCSIAITITVMVYGAYLSFSGAKMTELYGPLTQIIILLLLAYFISYIIFVCFYLNILLAERKSLKRQDENRKKVAKITKKKKNKDQK